MTATSAGLGLLLGALVAAPIWFFTGNANVGAIAIAAALIGIGLIATNTKAMRRYLTRQPRVND